jgi:hypothetical protein
MFQGAAGIEQAGEGTPGVFTGACCLGEACSVLSAADCADAGGVYLGDFTVCFPNPCVTPPETGACCVDGECSILTLADCEAAGGDWFADTPCDPNPCTLPPCCPGAFDAFDGSGRKFLTMQWVGSFNDHCGDCMADGNATRSDFYDPADCESGLFCECSGTVEDSIRGPASTDACNGFLDPYSGDLGSPSWQDAALLPCLISSGPAIGCGSGSASLASDSATERVWNFSFPGCADGSGSLTVTLSDECTP